MTKKDNKGEKNDPAPQKKVHGQDNHLANDNRKDSGKGTGESRPDQGTKGKESEKGKN